jgi:hypothetical protein
MTKWLALSHAAGGLNPPSSQQIVRWREPGVVSPRILIAERGYVALCRVQPGVPEAVLHVQYRRAVADRIDSEGMSQPMNSTFLQARLSG